MPDETAIRRLEELLVDITRLGGENERTSIVPNLTVVDTAPAGLTNFITIADERDGDTILAKTVPGVVYAVSDKVNVLFVEGTEPIAYQQGSESPNAGLWGIVPSTSTDIFYNNGDIAIGKSVAPDASLEILGTAQAQLRLTNIEDTTFVDLTLDASHDLTITPSSTGQVIFQPTTDSTDFFQILDANGGTPILNVDSTNERLGIRESSPVGALHVTWSDFNEPPRFEFIGGGATAATFDFFHNSGTPANNDGLGRFQFIGNNDAGVPEEINFSSVAGYARVITDGSEDGELRFRSFISGTDTLIGRWIAGDLAIGSNSIPAAKLDVDQFSATGAKPVLLLDQADVSEEMIEFVSTIGVGNAIEAVGAKTLTVTHFIKVTLPGSLTRYIEVGTIA